MVIYLERDADLHMVQLMPLPRTVSCFSGIQIGFAFLVPAHPGSPGKRAVKRVCVGLVEKVMPNTSAKFFKKTMQTDRLLPSHTVSPAVGNTANRQQSCVWSHSRFYPQTVSVCADTLLTPAICYHNDRLLRMYHSKRAYRKNPRTHTLVRATETWPTARFNIVKVIFLSHIIYIITSRGWLEK